MITFTHIIGRAVALSIGVLFFFNALLASPRSVTPDLTNSVWKWVDEDLSFSLTFTQVKHEKRELVAILNGWGSEPLELHGQYSENTSEPHLRITGSYEGETIVFDLKFNSGDHEQLPFLHGEFSVGSKVFSVSPRCDQQCPDISEKKDSITETPNAASVGIDLVGEWEDLSEALGFKEHWSIKSVDGQWQIFGQFIKGEEVIGSFHAEEVAFDPKTNTLSFQQIFDQKPDETWVASNNIEATAQGDTLKIKVREVEATLTRATRNKK